MGFLVRLHKAYARMVGHEWSTCLRCGHGFGEHQGRNARRRHMSCLCYRRIGEIGPNFCPKCSKAHKCDVMRSIRFVGRHAR